MKQDLLGRSAKEHRKMLKRNKAICTAVAVLVVLLNILLLLLRNDENHTVMMTLSIISTVLGGFFVVAFADLVILPQKKLYRLACRRSEPIFVKLELIEDKTECVEGFDCYRVHAGDRIFFLIADGNIELFEGQEVTLFVSSGIITGVEI